MPAVYYSSEQVDPVLTSLKSLLTSTLTFAKEAQAKLLGKDQEIAALKAAAGAPKVILQKVADAAPLGGPPPLAPIPSLGGSPPLPSRIDPATGKPGVVKTAFDPKIMKETLDFLEAQAVLDPEKRAETIIALNEDPNFALKLAARVAQISAPAHQEGTGFRKSAAQRQPAETPTAPSEEDDGWVDVARYGAA